MGVTWFRLE